MGMINGDNQGALKKYINGLFQDSFSGNLRGIVFDVANLDNVLIDDYFNRQSDIFYYSHIFTENDIIAPYYPFLSSIKDYFIKTPIEEFEKIFEELKIYSLHKDLFRTFFYEKKVRREPSVLREEVYFEELMIYDGIVKLLNYISRSRDLVFYLSDLHHGKRSTLSIFKHILEHGNHLNILIIATMDTDIIEDNEDNNIYEKLIECIEDKEWMMRLDLNFLSDLSYYEGNQQNTEEVLRYLLECLEFLAIQDCIDYGKSIYNEFSNKTSPGFEKSYIQLLKILGKAYYLLKEKESALFYDNLALSIAQEYELVYEICDINCRLGYDYSIRGESQIAKKYALVSIKQAEVLGDEKLIYNCMFLQFIINKEALFIDMDIEENGLELLISKTKELGYSNNLSMIYTNPYELHDNFTPLKDQRFDEGIKISIATGNDHQLGVAYHNRGIVFSRLGEMDKAFYYYLKSQRIKELIGDSKRVAYIYNSLGFYYFLTEKYELSHREYLKSFIASGKSRDYHEVGMTLYNLALNAFLYGKYTLSSEYMGKLIKLMKISHVNELKYHSKKMIYDIYIISLFKSQQEVRAKDIYSKVKIWELKEIENKNEELFIGLMTDFYMIEDSKNSEILLDEAEQFISIEDQTIAHFRKFFYLEKALFYRRKKDNYYKRVIKMAQSEFEEGLHKEFAKKMLWTLEYDQVMPEPSTKLQSIDMEYNQIIYTAKIDQNLLVLRNRLNEINFLNMVQNMLMSENDIHQLLLRLQQLIHGNTNVEKTYCRLLKNGSFLPMNIDNDKLLINEVYADRIFAYLKDKSKPSLIQSGNVNLLALKKVYGYSSILYLPIHVESQRKVELLFMTQRSESRLNQDDLSILTLIGRQMGEAVERINKNKALEAMNRKLKHLSDTDLLTGLNNRNALENYLQKEQAMVTKGQTKNLLMLFIDLDNFKYYNDTFGHGIGDEVLNQFGQVLKDVVDQEDFVARFGGDEFVIILKDKDEEAAHIVAHEIYRQLKKRLYFEGSISQLLKSQIRIPKEHHLSCSIGLSNLNEIESRDVDELLKISDAALYKAKSLGKSRMSKL